MNRPISAFLIAASTMGMTLPVVPGVSAPMFEGGLDPAISQVVTGGTWEEDDMSGYYRVVVRTHCSPEHCFDQAYIQWIEIASRESAPREGRTVHVTEAGDFAVVSKVEFLVGSDGAAAIQFELVNTYSMESAKLCVRPAYPGSYQTKDGDC